MMFSKKVYRLVGEKMTKKNIKIRIATINDATELLDIYAHYVTNTAITFEYDVPSKGEFENRIRNTLKKYPYLVAELEGNIVGYAYAGEFKIRAAYQWNVETSIYVHKDYKHMGIGKQLYQALENILKSQNILNVNACIAYPVQEDEYLTKDSVNFHQKLGYSLVGEFHQSGYKFNRWYNMVWMEKFIGVHVENQPEVIAFQLLADRYK